MVQSKHINTSCKFFWILKKLSQHVDWKLHCLVSFTRVSHLSWSGAEHPPCGAVHLVRLPPSCSRNWFRYYMASKPSTIVTPLELWVKDKVWHRLKNLFKTQITPNQLKGWYDPLFTLHFRNWFLCYTASKLPSTVVTPLENTRESRALGKSQSLTNMTCDIILLIW